MLRNPDTLQLRAHLPLYFGVSSFCESDAEDDTAHTTSKPMQQGQQFLDSEHVSNVKDTLSGDCYFVKADALPSMLLDLSLPTEMEV